MEQTKPAILLKFLRHGRATICRCIILLLLHMLPAAASACSLALVVAVDVSASINDDEYSLQQRGIAEALRHPDVAMAIEAVGGIWLHAFEWSGRYQQNTYLNWVYLSDPSSVHSAALQIEQHKRDNREFMTALGHAMTHASKVLNQAPQRCDRQVVDVSADGINNEGYEPRTVYTASGFTDVTVNALVIRREEKTFNYFLNKVIRGPGAFAQPLNSYEDYTDAMVRKFVREILGDAHAFLDGYQRLE